MHVTNVDLPRGAFLRPELPEAALHGLPGDVTRTLAERSDADPAALLLGFLTMLGNAAGAEPHIMVGGQPQPGRLFTLMVGDAATGRKGTALALVLSVFEDADPDWSGSALMSGAQSGEAVVSRVMDSNPQQYAPDGQQTEKRLMILESEYGRLLERMSGSTLSQVLRQAWDGSVLAVERVKGRPSIRAANAHVSMIGQITPAELTRFYPRLAAGNGLESRCLYAYVSKQEKDVSPFAEAAAPHSLIKRVEEAISGSRARTLELTDPVSRELLWRRNLLPSCLMGLDDDVADWRDIRDNLPVVNKDLGGMFDRAFTHVIRLASLYALADGSPLLRAEHIDAATALWTYCARSAEVIFSIPAGNVPSQVDPKRRAQVFDALYRAWPGWLSATQLRDEFSRNTSKNRIDMAPVLEALVAEGRAEVKKLGTKGRPRTEYRLTYDAARPRLRAVDDAPREESA
jgi:hypothetical protein